MEEAVSGQTQVPWTSRYPRGAYVDFRLFDRSKTQPCEKAIKDETRRRKLKRARRALQEVERMKRNKVCPRCRKRMMRASGAIKVGIKGGLRKVYRCGNCGYQSIR